MQIFECHKNLTVSLFQERVSNFPPEVCFSELGGGDGSSLDPSMASQSPINHLISRESTMDIGVGDWNPNSGRGEEEAAKCKEEKDLSKS